ncbi:MAG TPA: 4Fe-4S dicluster domain-containing protein [Myxococcota bacterium]|nr:4Fe-4S dicluster domain-containing protein [Myxococcota bacterium]
MNYGFVIDNRRCIGCHACSTACKSENQVPLGVYRTWVKYTEVGRYPEVTRQFRVTRCNHCDDPACVRICPVAAMYRRSDGIVEVDGDACIGCKSCMQACPYDAIYVDPETGTAAKCHYCAHRVENGVEPACVVVCPVHAIIAGDLDDPASEASRARAADTVTVRKPEQGTSPQLFYVEDAAEPKEPVVVAHEARYEVPWHWPVPAYLVTKGVAAGLPFLMALGVLGLYPLQAHTVVLGGLLALVCLGLTTGLLVYDLERPERFLRILLRPQWRSWLTRGGFVLVAYSCWLTAWWGLEAAVWMEWMEAVPFRAVLAEGTLPLALGAAVYTAFLFAQAKGRDLWQGRLVAQHLAVSALMLGSGVLALFEPDQLLSSLFGAALLVGLVLMCAEILGPHSSEVAARAATGITSGRYRNHWRGSIALHLVALGLLVVGAPPGLPLLAAVAGLYLYEHAFVMAPQEVPNS